MLKSFSVFLGAFDSVVVASDSTVFSSSLGASALAAEASYSNLSFSASASADSFSNLAFSASAAASSYYL